MGLPASHLVGLPRNLPFASVHTSGLMYKSSLCPNQHRLTKARICLAGRGARLRPALVSLFQGDLSKDFAL